MLAAFLLASALAGEAAYRIDPKDAEAGFDLKATMHTVHGKTTDVSGEVSASGDPSGVRTLSGRIEVDAATLYTGNASRDTTLHETTLAVHRFPRIVLVPERIVPSGRAAGDGALTGTITGAITIRDVTRPVEIAATLRETPERIDVEGTFDVPWTEFGLPDPSFLFVKVAKIAHARFRVTLVREGR